MVGLTRSYSRHDHATGDYVIIPSLRSATLGDENRDDREIGFTHRSPNQTQMPFMQSAHRRNQTDRLVSLAHCANDLAECGNFRDHLWALSIFGLWFAHCFVNSVSVSTVLPTTAPLLLPQNEIINSPNLGLGSRHEKFEAARRQIIPPL